MTKTACLPLGIMKSKSDSDTYRKGFYDGQISAFKHMEKIAKACRKVAVEKA